MILTAGCTELRGKNGLSTHYSYAKTSSSASVSKAKPAAELNPGLGMFCSVGSGKQKEQQELPSDSHKYLHTN